MTRNHSTETVHHAVERRLVADAHAARLDVPDGLQNRILERLGERSSVRPLRALRPWALAAASLLVGWTLVVTTSIDPVKRADIELGPWTEAFKVGRWVAPSDGAVHRQVDVALIGEWQAMVTDASRAANTVLDGFARPLRGWNARASER